MLKYYFRKAVFLLTGNSWLLWIKFKLLFQRPLKNNFLSRKVTHINFNETGGGAYNFASSLHRSIEEKYFTSEMLVINKSSDDHRVKMLVPNNNFTNGLNDTFQYQNIFNIRFSELKRKIDKGSIVHLNNLHPSFFSPYNILFLSKRNKLVWTIHDMHPFTGHCAHSFNCEKWLSDCKGCPDLSLYPLIEKDTAGELYRIKQSIYSKIRVTVVCPSEWIKRKVEKSILKNQKIKIIYNGIDVTVFKKSNKEEVRKKFDMPMEKKIILFSANLGINNPFKGGEFVEKIIKSSFEENILFINVGGGKIVEKLPNLWNIPFISNPIEMAEYYSAADIFLYPTLADNCPLAVLEAMACGLPVLTFNVGGVPELVQHNKTGYIAQYKNFEDLYNGLLVLLNNAELRMEMSANAISRVKENFTLEMMSENYLKLYEEVLNERIE